MIHATMHGWGCGFLDNFNLATVTSDTTFMLVLVLIISLHALFLQCSKIWNIEWCLQSSPICFGAIRIYLTTQRKDESLEESISSLLYFSVISCVLGTQISFWTFQCHMFSFSTLKNNTHCYLLINYYPVGSLFFESITLLTLESICIVVFLNALPFLLYFLVVSLYWE